ncbi:MotA/TolQ/ExbB proton channel family protein [Bradymonadaceae bacterium TMQ3]|uniref:MotA/TolQ/ExbB proton channel family protein n=1 Tax=Lujinxingia sediminis TaxID=2480984 RepID=A0ABY0CPA5_9DELT|nr:MotA/TolQ/ExbB proton channel family protein [Lujinxingia sediminis]RDV38032.1 MotA/TolQ/ExbB proton channel family protein [Bradymonadaceae bacterium TMQ3]RVU42298.1 MotA/TolQ/ExbB proton channel family protein [Lujinxingia sediminis]TXC75703.1 MotA/TolQ/ExbB proton channel family protein [Bradymonadales bacterium TMQ1]
MAGIAEAFRDGGIWMYSILAVSVVALGVTLERFFFLFFKYNMNAQAFMAQIQKLVMADNVDRAIKLCNAAPSRVVPYVIKAGLTRANKGEVEIQNAMEEAALEIVPKVQKRTNALLTIANVATLLGLLGTIVGLIGAFEALETATPENRQRMLSRGIAMAMNTTAFGLIVAIPTMISHLLLSGVTKKILDDVDMYSVKLENLLVTRGKGGPVE